MMPAASCLIAPHVTKYQAVYMQQMLYPGQRNFLIGHSTVCYMVSDGRG